jgi:uncharacterized protein (TIGR02453 family)
MADLVFEGFPRATFTWLAGIEKHNTREWFQASREVYEGAVRGALEAMLEDLADEYGGRVKMFRQHRDVRFSKDKSPYKTTTYGLIADRPDSLAGLYAQLSSSGLFAGTGYHVLASDQLERFREAVLGDRTGAVLERAITKAEAGGIETFGEALKTAPRGYPRDHPRGRLLRHKSLVAGRRHDAGTQGMTAKSALGHVRSTWRACAPLNAWLDAHVGASAIEQPARYRR